MPVIDETWAASKYGVLYLDNPDTPFPKRIAGFEYEDSDPDPDPDPDVARARLAAQAPAMARLLKETLNLVTITSYRDDVTRVLCAAGVLP